MESFFARYRNLLALLAIVGAQLIGLATQVRHGESGRNSLAAADGSGVRLIRLWASALVTPPERAMHATKLGIENTWNNYIDLHRVRRQNQELQQTVDRLRLEQAALLEDARQGERLQQLMAFQQHYIYSTLAAQAIGSSGTNQSRVIYLDKGSDDGLKPDMAVITADGIVGKIRDVFPHTAQVLVINDQSSGAGVILETTRIRGILRGGASGQAGDRGHSRRREDQARRACADGRRRPDLSARIAGGRGREGGARPGFRRLRRCDRQPLCAP